MAKFPGRFEIEYAKGLPPGVGPSVRGQIDFRTGEEQIGRALTGAGQAIAGIGDTLLRIQEKRQQMDDSRAFTFANAAIKDAEVRHQAFREATPDTKLWEGNRKQLFDDARVKSLSRPQSDNHRSLMTARFDATDKTSTAITYAAATRRERIDTNEAMDYDLLLAFTGGDSIEIKSSLDRWINHWSTEVDPAELRQKLGRIKALGEKRNLEQRTTQVYLEALPMSVEDGLNYINASGLPITELSKARTEFMANKNAMKRKEDALTDNYINERNKAVIDVLSVDPDDSALIDQLPPILKELWKEKQVKRDASIEAGEGDPFVNKYDPAVYNALDIMIKQNPKAVKESQIIALVGDGITAGQGQWLVERRRKLLRKDSPLTSSPAKRTIKRIDKAFDTGVIKHPDYIEGAEEGSEDEYKNRVLRDQMIDDFEAFVAEKNPSPKEMLDYTSSQLAPYEAVFVRNYRWLVPSIGIYTSGVTRFSKKEYEDAIESLNKEARKEWAFTKRETAKGWLRQATHPGDFLKKWQSPNKIATPEIGAIYLKWAKGDRKEAKAMMIKEGWKAGK